MVTKKDEGKVGRIKYYQNLKTTHIWNEIDFMMINVYFEELKYKENLISLGNELILCLKVLIHPERFWKANALFQNGKSDTNYSVKHGQLHWAKIRTERRSVCNILMLYAYLYQRTPISVNHWLNLRKPQLFPSVPAFYVFHRSSWF